MSDLVGDMATLVRDVWRHYVGLQAAPFVVQPALPILFFGDQAQYRRSAVRVVTAGLNPSLHEFPAAQPARRFMAARELCLERPAEIAVQPYLTALSEYFRCDPYRRWFSCFEPLLNGLGASYYDQGDHRALNTDLCSPLATAPTWSGLSAAEQAQLIDAGFGFWERLIALLEPDVIVISVAETHRRRIEQRLIEPWTTIYTVARRKDGTAKRRPYQVAAARMRLPGGKLALAVWGPAAHTPFGLIPNADKVAIGQRIAALVSEPTAGCGGRRWT